MAYDDVARKVCRFLEIGTIALPRELSLSLPRREVQNGPITRFFGNPLVTIRPEALARVLISQIATKLCRVLTLAADQQGADGAQKSARMRFSSPALPQRLAESVFLHSFVAIWQYLLASYRFFGDGLGMVGVILG